MTRSRISTISLAAAIVAVVAIAGSAGAASPASSGIRVMKDSDLKPQSAAFGGASVLPTTRTVQHWHGSTLDPHNGVTYGYNMVGVNPNGCGSACSSTVTVDITPINIVVGGLSFKGSDVLGATLASPQFTATDFTTTPHSTVIVPANNGTAPGFGSGGALSADNTNVQLEDATMRSQFNKVGSDPYHLILSHTTRPTVTITVPSNQGVLLQSVRGIVFPAINISWWSAKINNLLQSENATHLPLYLTDSLVLYIGNPGNCCVIGYHGTRAAGLGNGNTNSNGNAAVQTFAWASYVTPGIFNPQVDWALQDIHALSHEIAEWGDDPFVNNLVDPWVTPTAPQYGCTNILETGDPVVAIGFSAGTNNFRQQPSSFAWDSGGLHHAVQTTDGTYHPEDEALLPWFLRSDPSTSQPTQTTSAKVGRYTFMGDLNPYPGFRAPATGC